MDARSTDIFWSAQVGAPAPPFAVLTTDGVDRRRVTLDEFTGRWLMLLFYPRDFTFVCPTELTAFSAEIAEFSRRDCALLGVSVDTIETHEQWLRTSPEQGGLGPLHFPLASDPGGEMARSFGVYVDDAGVAGRGLFLIDPEGVLQYQVVHNLNTGRSTNETLRVLDAIQQGGLCPSNWTRGDGTIDPSLSLHRGTVLGHYRISSKLGQGGFAQVLSAWDMTLERVVALKVIRPGKKVDKAHVLAEARAAAGLSHPNICAIFAVEEIEGLPVIAMEYLRGRSLSQRLREGPMEADEVRAVVRDVCAGLVASHAQGIVHGDLKPANIMLLSGGGTKILDFGVARRAGSDPPSVEEVLTLSGPGLDPTVQTSSGPGLATPSDPRSAGDSRRRIVIQGTPAYMAPEILAGEKTSPAVDVFVLGLVIAEMLTGKRVIGGTKPEESFRTLRRLQGKSVAAKVPHPFRAALVRALHRDPEQRLTVAELAAML